MANLHLTQRRVDAFKPGKSARDIRDTELRGFGVRILPSGRKRYFVHAQNNGRRVWTTIGDAGTMPVSEARERALSLLAALRKKEPSSKVEDSAETPFEDVAEAVFRRCSRNWKPGTLRVNRQYLKHQILPRFRGQPIGAISSRDVQQWFASLRSTPAAADRAVPILSVIMREAEVQGHRPEGSNPCRNIRRYRRRGLERFLSREETHRLGVVLARYDGDAQAAAVRFLLLTGCRKNEILTLLWPDYRDGHLFLRDSKTGPRTVALSGIALAVLDRQPVGCGPFVFPSAVNPERPRGTTLST